MTAAKQAYINRVKKGIELYAAMESLKNMEKLTIEFGSHDNIFEITAFDTQFSNRTERSYTISELGLFGRSMNIDSEKSGKSYLYCYTFDLFKNKTVAKLYFEHITIVETKKETL